MKKKRHVVKLLIAIITLVSVLATILPLTNRELDLWIFIPLGGEPEIMLTFFLMIIASILGGVIGGYLFSPLFLWVHMKILGRNKDYAFQEISPPSKGKKLSDVFFSSLIAINFALALAIEIDIAEAILVDLNSVTAPALYAFIGLLPIMTFIGAALFSPVWFLLEAGIVYSNADDVEGRGQPIEVESVGTWYSHIIEGYAGISVILYFYLFLNVEIMHYLAGTSVSMQSITIIVAVILFPLILTALSLPTLIILDKTRESRVKYITKYAKKFEISDVVSLEIKKTN